jgi:hypothetical protein
VDSFVASAPRDDDARGVAWSWAAPWIIIQTRAGKCTVLWIARASADAYDAAKRDASGIAGRWQWN